MTRIRTTAAIVQVVLISPAALFMGALLVRRFGPLESDPARTAQRVVTLYAGRLWTLWGLLIALPVVVLLIGCLTLTTDEEVDVQARATVGDRSPRMHPAGLLVTTATVAAAAFLAIVVIHMLAN